MDVDFRSDTLTLPTPGMKEAMMNAPLGDDVFGEDPTIKALEEKIAKIFNMDGALFCPSGTMANQIAIRMHTRPCDEVIAYEGSHVYKYEGGGAPGNSGISFKLLKGDRGRISVSEIEGAINPDDIHAPPSRLVVLENTVNSAGGSCYHGSEIQAIARTCKERGLLLHMDGARVFNALVATGESPDQIGPHLDSLSVCLSKGLGAPVGSVLLYKKEYSRRALRLRKIMGGGMRQAGMLAAAGIYALDNHIDRLAQDHEQARIIGGILARQEWVRMVHPIETNIIIFETERVEVVLNGLQKHGIRALGFGPGRIRMVTHLNITRDMSDHTLKVIPKII